MGSVNMEMIELDKERILTRIGYTFPTWRVFVVRGVGYVGACELITPGQGSFGQSGRAVLVIQNFVKFCREGYSEASVPSEYLVKKLPNTRVTDENLVKRIGNALEKGCWLKFKRL